jgi:2-polyprenyl-6-methoxyphenol hydroxylase-like FAD-dependent oxidoreductase
LTTGILDAAVLGNVLNRILKLEASDDLLSEYEGTRRTAFLEFTNPLSIGNKERMTSTDPEKVAEREWFFNKLNTEPEFHVMVNRSMDKAMEETFEVPEVL